MRCVVAFVCLLDLALVFLSPVRAQQVMVSPSSVIFEERVRSAEVIVANTGEQTSTYRIEPTYFTMKEDGTLTEVEGDQPSDSALRMLRYSPRQFQLDPGESQIVRLAVRKPASLATGEYRAHLRITNMGAVQKRPKLPTASGDTLVQVNISVSRAIRVVVRHGVSSAPVTVTGLAAKGAGKDQIEVSFELQRRGQTSSRGEYVLFARDRQTGTTAEKFVHRGVIVYPELSSRRVSHLIPTAKLKRNLELCVVYRNTEGTGGKKANTRCINVSSQ